MMPLDVCRKLNLGDTKSTDISLQLVDKIVKPAFGVLEDVPIKVGHLYIPTNFVIIDIEKDFNVLIILGRPLLAFVRAVIYVKQGY